MSRKQIALLVLLNAVVSSFLSLAVVAGAVFLLRDRVAFVAPGATTAPKPAAAGEQVLPSGEAEQVPTAANAEQATAGATPVIHIVASGETLGFLAQKYDVPQQDIIAVNQIQNPDLLTPGQRLVIPIGGAELVEPTNTPAPTATDTPIPFEPPSAQMTATAAAEAGATVTPLPTPLPNTGELQIEIVEVIQPGVVAQEGVKITAKGLGRAKMAGWTLNDSEGNSYTFPLFSLWADGTVTVYTRAGQDTTDTLYWGQAQALWQRGEAVTLKDMAGDAVAIFTVGE